MEETDKVDDVTVKMKSLKEERRARKKRIREQQKIEKEEREKEEATKRKEAALAQMRYLLSICEQYSEVYRKTINEEKALKNKNTFVPTLDDIEDVKKEMKKQKTNRPTRTINVTEHLKYFEGGKLHPYQVEGLRWLYMLHSNSSNGILADEMGLGKTVQIIALICVLYEQNAKGPFLIVAPLSTIPNWQGEFKRFAPQIPVVSIVGRAESRQENIPKIYRKHTLGNKSVYPVVIVSYQTPLLDFRSLDKCSWK